MFLKNQIHNIVGIKFPDYFLLILLQVLLFVITFAVVIKTNRHENKFSYETPNGAV